MESLVQILNEGKLGQKKNMCLPGVSITLPTINHYDEYDIVEFGLKKQGRLHRSFIHKIFKRFKIT